MADQEQEIKPKVLMKKAECSQCGGMRNCDIVGHYDERGGDDHFEWLIEWKLMRCRGCEHVFVQTVSGNSEDYHQSYGPDGEVVTEYHEVIKYWPALAKRKKPEWMSEAGIDAENVEALNEALAELYGALNNDLHMLAAIGIRTCFDVAAELLGIKPEQTFKAKLQNLVTSGHIGKVDQTRLEILVDAGSASAHRGWRPGAEDLNTLMDVLEHFVHDAFVARTRKKRLDANVKKMQAQVPPRKTRGKAAAGGAP